MSRIYVLYDGQCPFCQGCIRLLRRLDWLGRLDYFDARHPEAFPPGLPPLDPARLMVEMHVVTATGQVLAGFRAVRYLAWYLPVGWPVAPLLYLPGVPTLGQWLYLKVARNRYNLVPCKDGVCSLPPQSTQPRTRPQADAVANPPPPA